MGIGIKFRLRLIGIVLLTSLSFTVMSPSLAHTAKLAVVPSSEAVKTREEARIKALRSKGDNLISNRIKAMNAAINRLKKATRISDEDKNTLTGDLQSNIDTLDALEQKIDAETNLDNLRSQVRSIFVDYRIYMVVLPRNRGLFAVARFNWAISRLENATSQLESLINTLKQGGKDTSKVEGYLIVLKSYLNNAKADVASAKSTFSSMTPEKDDEAKSTVKSGIQFLKAAARNLKNAAKEAQKIISWIEDNN